MENQKFGITQFAEQVNYQRALEGELARSVQSIGSVASARVHLAIPKPSVFVKEQPKPSASVILNLHSGRLLDAAQASAIIHLISSSVPELSAKNVTLVDQNGTLLSSSRDGTTGEGMDASQLKYVQGIEQNYIKRIEDILTPLLGANNVRAQVTADIDFSRTEQTAEIYKPNQNPTESTVRSQQLHEVMNGSGLSASGVPGALSNQPPVPATAPIVAAATPGAKNSANDVSLSNLQKESTVNYEVDRTIRHTMLPVGMIKRLSVAVVVNGSRRITDAKGKVVVKTLSDAEKTQINNLVRDAMGFDQERGDNLNVQVAAFNEDKEVIEALPLWKQPGVTELAKEIFKYLAIGAVMLFAVFGIIKPALRPLFVAPEFRAGEDEEQANAPKLVVPDANAYNPTAPSYDQNLHTAREISK